jgi:hypothetical protein
VLDIERWKTFARCSLPMGRATLTGIRNCRQRLPKEGVVGGLYQVPEGVTRWGDSRIGCGLIQDGKHMEVCHDGGDFVAG